MRIAVARDRGGLAVGDSKGGYALLIRLQNCLNRYPQTLAEADCYQQVSLGQQLHLVLNVAFAARRRLGIESERRQTVCEVPGQRLGEVNSYDHNAARS